MSSRTENIDTPESPRLRLEQLVYGPVGRRGRGTLLRDAADRIERAEHVAQKERRRKLLVDRGGRPLTQGYINSMLDTIEALGPVYTGHEKAFIRGSDTTPEPDDDGCVDGWVVLRCPECQGPTDTWNALCADCEIRLADQAKTNAVWPKTETVFITPEDARDKAREERDQAVDARDAAKHEAASLRRGLADRDKQVRVLKARALKLRLQVADQAVEMRGRWRKRDAKDDRVLLEDRIKHLSTQLGKAGDDLTDAVRAVDVKHRETIQTLRDQVAAQTVLMEAKCARTEKAYIAHQKEVRDLQYKLQELSRRERMNR